MVNLPNDNDEELVEKLKNADKGGVYVVTSPWISRGIDTKAPYYDVGLTVIVQRKSSTYDEYVHD